MSNRCHRNPANGQRSTGSPKGHFNSRNSYSRSSICPSFHRSDELDRLSTGVLVGHQVPVEVFHISVDALPHRRQPLEVSPLSPLLPVQTENRSTLSPKTSRAYSTEHSCGDNNRRRTKLVGSVAVKHRENPPVDGQGQRARRFRPKADPRVAITSPQLFGLRILDVIIDAIKRVRRPAALGRTIERRSASPRWPHRTDE